MGDVILLTVGGYTCDRIPFNDPPLAVGNYSDLYCVTSKNLKSGLYNGTIQNTIGYYVNTRYSIHYSQFADVNYMVSSISQLSSISTSKGSLGGNRLVINGSNIKSDAPITVDAAGQPCDVTSVTDTQIKCTVRAVANPAEAKYGKLPF